jgi:hypothetical protein
MYIFMYMNLYMRISKHTGNRYIWTYKSFDLVLITKASLFTIQAYIHVHTNQCITYQYIHIDIHMNAYVNTYACIYIYIYLHIHIYVYLVLMTKASLSTISVSSWEIRCRSSWRLKRKKKKRSFKYINNIDISINSVGNILLYRDCYIHKFSHTFKNALIFVYNHDTYLSLAFHLISNIRYLSTLSAISLSYLTHSFSYP